MMDKGSMKAGALFRRTDKPIDSGEFKMRWVFFQDNGASFTYSAVAWALVDDIGIGRRKARWRDVDGGFEVCGLSDAPWVV